MCWSMGRQGLSVERQVLERGASGSGWWRFRMLSLALQGKRVAFEVWEPGACLALNMARTSLVRAGRIKGSDGVFDIMGRAEHINCRC